jgi:AraC family transcriptional regulator of arabinose operon
MVEMTILMAKMIRHLSKPILRITSLRLPRQIKDLRLVTAGHHPEKTQWIDHAFAVYAVGLVVNGRGTYRVDGGPPQPVHPGTQFSVFPGATFTYGPDPGTAWEEYYVVFSGRRVRQWIGCKWFPVDKAVHAVAGLGPLVERWRELIHTVGRAAVGDGDRAVLMAERLLLEMYLSRTPSRAPREPAAQIEAVLAHCHQHFARPIDFIAMADQYEMSYSHLRQQIRKATGLPPHQYVIRLRCESAQKLLGETDLPIHEIGDRVGVPDPYTFSRTFSRCVGMSPQRYRKTIERLGSV